MALEEKGFDPPAVDAQPDEPPPFLGTWPRVYRVVVAYLFLLIVVLSLVTRAFAPHS